MVSLTKGRLRFSASACSPGLVWELVRIFAKKSLAREPGGPGVSSCARWGGPCLPNPRRFRVGNMRDDAGEGDESVRGVQEEV